MNKQLREISIQILEDNNVRLDYRYMILLVRNKILNYQDTVINTK
jgi:hypothetical protein